jgi:hypothetical protein
MGGPSIAGLPLRSYPELLRSIRTYPGLQFYLLDFSFQTLPPRPAASHCEHLEQI